MEAPESGARVGLIGATTLVIASMVGVGVFTTSGFALGDLGDPRWVLLAWVVGGVLALLGAISYGALARRMPESGGEYHFLQRVAHPLVGFLAGWVSLLAGFTAPIAAAAAGLQLYLSSWIGEEQAGAIGTLAIVAAGLIHGFRLRSGALMQASIVGFKIMLITAFAVFGVSQLPPIATAEATAAPFELTSFAVTLVWVSFSYSGWNAAVYIASEVRDPRRTVPRAMILGTLVVVVLYVLLNAVFVYSAPFNELAGKKDIAAIAANAIGGPTLGGALGALIAVALFTSISANVMAGPRVYARMAEDGVFPRLFDARARVPGAAIALQVALAVVVLWSTTLLNLLTYIGFTLSLSTAGTVGVLLWLRRREGPERVPVPGYPWVQMVFIAATLAIGVFVAMRKIELFAAGIATVVSGVPLYYIMRAWRRRVG